MKRKMIFVTTGAAGVLLAGTAATAAMADTSSSSPSPKPGTTQPKQHNGRKGGLVAECKREPKQAARVNKLIARFSGDATTKGSVQWLNARAAKVQAKDPALAAIITDRANARQSQLNTLKIRKDELAKIAAYCGTKGHPVGS